MPGIAGLSFGFGKRLKGMNQRVRIGITGNIGSGKTMVSRLLESAGIPVYYADEEARHLLMRPENLERLRARWGSEVFRGSHLDLQKLASVVFRDSEALRFIEKLIHPQVWQDFDRWCADQVAPVVAMESALLVDRGYQSYFDLLVLVVAPEEVRARRVGSAFWVRQSVQMPDREKYDQTHIVIVNDEARSLLAQVEWLVAYWLPRHVGFQGRCRAESGNDSW